jgi:hypothetical protein
MTDAATERRSAKIDRPLGFRRRDISPRRRRFSVAGAKWPLDPQDFGQRASY